MTPDARLEALLFAAARPLALKQLAEHAQLEKDEVAGALFALEERLDASGSSLQLLRHGNEVELVTRPEAADFVGKIAHAEISGELTRPALEALTILAYCGPMTRAELEQIRGVQSALILRNLMLRGLVEQTEEEKLGLPLYRMTLDFIRHLGIKQIEALPDYERLRGHSVIGDALEVNASRSTLPV